MRASLFLLVNTSSSRGRSFSSGWVKIWTDIHIPQSIHVIEEAQIPDSYKIQLVGGSRITDSSRKRSFDTTRPPVTTDFDSRRNGIQLCIADHGTVRQMKRT